MLESSLFNVTTTTLDVDELTRLNQQLTAHINRIKVSSSTPEEEIEPYKLVTSLDNREQFISVIYNGGDLIDILNLVSKDATSRANLSR